MTVYDTDDYDTDAFMKKVEKGARAHHRSLMQLSSALGQPLFYQIEDFVGMHDGGRLLRPNAGLKQAPKPYSRYWVSAYGDVMGPKGDYLHQHVNNAGYEIVTVVKINGKVSSVPVHRLVALTWLPQPEGEGKNCVDHVDNNTLNNTLSNLRWVTYRENLMKSHRAKLMSGKGNGVSVDKVNDDGSVETYQSISAAARATGLSYSSVRGNAHCVLAIARPYHFEFVKSTLAAV